MNEDNFVAVVNEILAELCRAEHLHPVWPGVGRGGDHVWATAIVAEEAGEVLQAALNYQAHGKGTLGHLRKELIQTGAMVMRCLLNLEAVERQRINEEARQELSDEHNIYITFHGKPNYQTQTYRFPDRELTPTDYTEGANL